MSAKKTDNGDGTVTVTLKYPFESGKKNVTEVTIRTECTVADLEAMDAGKGDVDKTVRLIAELSEVSASQPGLSASTIRKMRSSDYLILSKIASSAISSSDDEVENDDGPKESRATGENS